MSLITAAERATYADVWGLPGYADHSPGEGLVSMFCDMAGIRSDQPFKGCLLDAGCGSGKGALALAAAGFSVTACDLVDGRIEAAKALTIPFRVACLWSDLRATLHTFEYVYCCDVLEHVPPEFTMLVIARLLECARRGVFLHIAHEPDGYGAFVGRPLHQTVQPFVWWRDRIKELGTLVECRDLIGSGAYYVRPR